VNQYLYQAFGQQSVLSGAYTNPFTWVGRLGYYRQADLDNYWLRARTYGPLTGRFLSRDPMPNGNLYIYPGNSPVVLVDPSGMQGCRGEECGEQSQRRPSRPRGRGSRGRYLRPRRATAAAGLIDPVAIAARRRMPGDADRALARRGLRRRPDGDKQVVPSVEPVFEYPTCKLIWTMEGTAATGNRGRLDLWATWPTRGEFWHYTWEGVSGMRDLPPFPDRWCEKAYGPLPQIDSGYTLNTWAVPSAAINWSWRGILEPTFVKCVNTDRSHFRIHTVRDPSRPQTQGCIGLLSFEELEQLMCCTDEGIREQGRPQHGIEGTLPYAPAVDCGRLDSTTDLWICSENYWETKGMCRLPIELVVQYPFAYPPRFWDALEDRMLRLRLPRVFHSASDNRILSAASEETWLLGTRVASRR